MSRGCVQGVCPGVGVSRGVYTPRPRRRHRHDPEAHSLDPKAHPAPTPQPRGTPAVDRQTPVKILPCPKLRLRAVKVFRFQSNLSIVHTLRAEIMSNKQTAVRKHCRLGNRLDTATKGHQTACLCRHLRRGKCQYVVKLLCVGW